MIYLMNKNERSQLDSNLLRTFVEIADCGNLTQAASRLNRSQSAISVQLRRLEEELNVSLFERSAKGMRVSLHGEKLMPLARCVLSDIDKLQALFTTPLKGRIRVGIPDDFEENVLERTLATFAHNHPGVEIAASSGCTANFPEAIRKGDLDIAVCSGTDNVQGDVFLQQNMVWAASKTLFINQSDAVPLAVINHRCWMGELPKKVLEQHERPYEIAFECSGLSSQKAAIRAGFSIGILLENNLEDDMKVLSIHDGFPPLPTVKRYIISNDNAPKELIDAMAFSIKHAI